MDDRRVVIGEVLRAHGVRGAMRVRATGSTFGGLRAGEAVMLSGRGEPPRTAVVRAVGAGSLLELEGVDDRDAADALRGMLLEVPEGRLPPPGEPDEFYVRDLVGCAVWIGDRAAGRVAEVHQRPANDVLEVVPEEGGDRLLLPFTHDAVLAVDLEARRIDVRADLLGPEV